MRNPQRYRSIGWVLMAALVYAFAFCCEAADDAGEIGFAEVVTWGRMRGALAEVGWKDLAAVGIDARDWISGLGMLGAVLLSIFSRRGISPWAAAGYLAVLTAAGGWVGFLAIYLPVGLVAGGWTGEFFEEGLARAMACGVWMVMILCYAAVMFFKRRKERVAAHA